MFNETALKKMAIAARLLGALGAGLVATILLLLALGAPVGVQAEAQATDWYVKPGGNDLWTCTSWASACKTIGAAVGKAASGDSIHVDAGTYSEHLVINKDLTITGTHPPRGFVTVINGSAPGPVIYVSGGRRVSLTGATIHNTQTSLMGGGIENVGTLTLNDVYLTNISNTNRGGGIYNVSSGKATLTDVHISGNTVGDIGAGIYNDGAMTVTNTTIESNLATTSVTGKGGGVVNGSSGIMIMASTVISDNTVVAYGGGIDNNGVMTVTGSTIANNRVTVNTYGDGGGIANWGTLYLEDVEILSNTAINNGGGIYNITTARLKRVNLLGNTADSYGGGIYNNDTVYLDNVSLEENTALDGGGLFGGDEAWLSSVTFYSNTTTNGTGAGIYNGFGGYADLINVTLSHNTAYTTSSSYGAGIYNNGSTLNAINCTIVYNHVVGGTSAGGVRNIGTGASLSLDNCIIAYNDNANCSGVISSSFGRNIDSSGDNTCDVDEDLAGVNPRLAPLAKNGSYTASYALLSDSPAIDNGENNAHVCFVNDQRGLPRPVDGDQNGFADCDIGSVEMGIQLYLPVVLR